MASGFEITPFQTIEHKTIKREKKILPVRRRVKAPESNDDRLSGILIKTGICAGVCAVLFALKLFDVPAGQQIVDGVRNAITQETSLDETLGKLKFVQLEDIQNVFGDDLLMDAPVNGTVAMKDEGFTVSVDVESDVTAAVDGSVSAVGTDAELGNYVKIKCADDTELTCYGLTTISVEQEQQVEVKDTIGTIAADKSIYVELRVAGSPADPAEYLNADTKY
jgi:hypothetical protein